MPADFAPVYAELRALMLRAADGMTVSKDTPQAVELVAPFAHPRKPGGPMWFGAVRTGKGYVGFHLMPLYVAPALMAQVTPGLKARMQGKSCFNFRAVDAALFADLETLTRACAQAFSTPPTP
jgi:hypothetical protein